MRKKGLGLVLLPVLILLPFTNYHLPITECFAEEESYTITTYYPSPYGSYNELSTNKFVVGDIDGDGKVTTSDQPPKIGSLYVAESIICKPKAGDPATWNTTNARAGELAYSSSNSNYYSFNGSAWVAQGGGTTYFLACNCPTGSIEVARVDQGVSLGGAMTTKWSETLGTVAPTTTKKHLGIATGGITEECCKCTAPCSLADCVKICKY